MLIKIDHLNISVNNLDQTVKFYHELFGLDIEEEGLAMDQVTPYKIIGRNDFHLCLYEKPSLKKEDILQSPVDHFGFRIDDPEDFKSRCKKMGIAFNYGGEIHHSVSSSWYVNDPSGYEIEVSFTRDGKIGFRS